jgi:hypothetical protein
MVFQEAIEEFQKLFLTVQSAVLIERKPVKLITIVVNRDSINAF